MSTKFSNGFFTPKILSTRTLSPNAARLQKSRDFTPEEAQRYSRHFVLPEVGPEGQRKLKDSSALVVGVGGLGTSAATHLASAGVGKIGLVDHDDVEISNLQRQFLFSEEDLGRRKVEVAKDALNVINPNVRIAAHDVRMISSNAMEIIRDYDIVIDATDNLPSRYLVNDACVLAAKHDVFASVLGFDGQVSVFYAPQGPCYRCLYPVPPPPESVRSCEDAGVLGAIPGILGGLQAVQATEILLGKGSPLIGRLLVFDGLRSSFEEIMIRKSEACPVCGPNPTVRSLIDYEEFCGLRKATSSQFDITPEDLSVSMSRGEDILLLDVREPYEFSLCSLSGARLIPLGELSEKMKELDRERDIVAYCHVGVRSLSAVSMLRRAGFTKVRNLKGGIDAWSKQIDPNISRY